MQRARRKHAIDKWCSLPGRLCQAAIMNTCLVDDRMGGGVLEL